MSVTPEYWFARRYPIGQARAGMAPVHWKGWAVVGGYVVGFILAAALTFWFAGKGDLVQAAFIFVAASFGLTISFISTSHKKGDHAHTVADYRGGNVRV